MFKGQSHIEWEDLWFPVDFPLDQSIVKMAFNILTMSNTLERISTCRNVCKKVDFAIAGQKNPATNHAIPSLVGPTSDPPALGAIGQGTCRCRCDTRHWNAPAVSIGNTDNSGVNILELRIYLGWYYDLVFRARTRPTIWLFLNF